MTLQEKLENFKSKPVGFHVRTEEIAGLIGEVLDSIGIKGNDGNDMISAMRMLWKAYHYKCDVLYISVNHPLYPGLMCGYCDESGSDLSDIYEFTVEEFEEYLGNGGEY